MELDREELKRLKAYAEEFKGRDWKWDGMNVEEDDDGDRWVHVRECSYLGDTAISLTSGYEGSGADCEYIQLLLKYGPVFIQAMVASLDDPA